MFYFLKEDFEELNAQIEKLCKKIREIGQEMGKSCQEGAETFHDNFAHEDGERQQYMWSNRLRELIRIRNNACVVDPDSRDDKISIGRLVTIEDEATGKTSTFRIGSYMVLKVQERSTFSYNSPLVRMLIGAKKDETRKGVVAGKKKVFQILKIE